MNLSPKKTILCLLLAITSIFAYAQSKKTNVIYILADDLGIGDLGIYGQKLLKTPNIDKLGYEGIKFTDHYSGNAVCSPSRAVLMSGQHPGHNHIIGNSPQEIPLKSEMTVLPELFKKQGYATGAFGKWGLGYTYLDTEASPLHNGFDEFYGWKTQYAAHTYYPTSMVHNGEKIKMKPGTYVHDEIMKNAFDFIEKNASENKPFFCYIPTAIPHAAMHAPKDLHDKWRKKLPQFEDVIGTYSAKEEPCPDVVNPVAAFAAMVEHLDNQVGEIIDLLKENGQLENTLIIFTSDNGAHNVGGHDPEFWNSTGVFRGMKRDMYEGGIRTPMLAYWPGVIQPGSETNHPSAFWDVMATAADILNVETPEQCDGISFLPTLRGKIKDQKEHEYLFWRIESYKIYHQAIRIGKWKGVLNWYKKTKKSPERKMPLELYDLSKDISEENNIADKNPKMVKRMMKIITEM